MTFILRNSKGYKMISTPTHLPGDRNPSLTFTAMPGLRQAAGEGVLLAIESGWLIEGEENDVDSSSNRCNLVHRLGRGSKGMVVMIWELLGLIATTFIGYWVGWVRGRSDLRKWYNYEWKH